MQHTGNAGPCLNSFGFNKIMIRDSAEYQQEIIDYTDDMEVDEKNSVDKIVNKYL